ncbi:MAG: NAD(+) synthase [Actinomycetota bacterium]
MKALAEKLISWIREQVHLAGCEGVVVGLSGGVDSSVTAVLCKKAFPNNSLVVILPCHSDPGDIESARLVAEKFDIDSTTVVLDEVFDLLLPKLSAADSCSRRKEMAIANLKPRLRMIALYYFANSCNYLVVGTGNKSELTVGYFSKYGDGGVDIMPLGNLLKTQVRELARELGIPKEIIEKPPSAGLWRGQTDEEELGVTYEELDQYLLTGKASREIKDKIDRLIEASVHKRQMPPVPSF